MRRASSRTFIPAVVSALDVSELRAAVVDIIKSRGARFGLPEPIRLASGALSHDYIDGKRAFAQGDHLWQVARALIELAGEEGVAYDAVGGLTMGSDPLAHAVAVLASATSPVSWFSVRKVEKDHGTKKRIEGADLGAGSSVFLVDDVVTTGGSIVEAYDAVAATGATVALATAVVDRGSATARLMAEKGIRYRALLTYADLGIEPVGT